MIVPALLRARSSDEYAPLPWSAADREAIARYDVISAAAAWAALVFGASETSVALLTSTPGPADVNVLTNRQIAAARDVVERYAGTGRVLTHTIVHPNLGAGELDAMVDWSATLRPSGWKCYTLWGPATKASPTGGWFLADCEGGCPFPERVSALGTPVV